MLNVIKEYLVKLGYAVDEPGFNKTQKSLESIDKTVATLSTNSALRFASMGAAITGFVGLAAGAIYKYTVGVAEADMQNQLFAARMWMNVESATAFKNSLDALGVSVQELYLSPELMQRYVQLTEHASKMTPPSGYSEAMRGVRNMTYEWARFKLEMTYGSYWIGYYLTKYIGGALGGTNISLKSINDWLEKNLDKWTRKIAQGLGNIYRLGSAGVTLLKTGYEYFNKLTPTVKAFLAVFTAGALGLLNPLTLIMAGLAGILLLIDDYNTWKAGGLSAWGKTWQELTESGDLARLSKSASDLTENLNKLLDFDIGENGEGTWIGTLIKALDTAFEKLNKVLYWIRTIKGETLEGQDSTPSDYWDPNGENYDNNVYINNPFGLNKGIVGLPIKNWIRDMLGATFKDPMLNWMGIGNAAPQHVEHGEQISYNYETTSYNYENNPNPYPATTPTGGPQPESGYQVAAYEEPPSVKWINEFAGNLQYIYADTDRMARILRSGDDRLPYAWGGGQSRAGNADIRMQQNFYINSNANAMELASNVTNKTEATLTRYTKGVLV